MFKYTKNAFFVLASNVFYTLMYYYSWAQIRTRRVANLVVPFFKQYVFAYFTKPAVPETETYATHVINWFKDGNSVNTSYLHSKMDNKEIYRTCRSFVDYNLVVLYGITKDNHTDYIVRCPSQILYPDYKLWDSKFLSVSLSYKGKIYEIELKTKDYNFYIVDNVINNHFITYFVNNFIDELKNCGSEDRMKPDDEYVLTILDNNVNTIHMTNKSTLKFTTDELYDIFHL